MEWPKFVPKFSAMQVSAVKWRSGDDHPFSNQGFTKFSSLKTMFSFTLEHINCFNCGGRVPRMLFYETDSQSGAKWFNFNICYSVSAHKGYFKTMASMTMGNLGQASVKVKHYILLFYM